MNELTLANRAADWHRLKALVLDSVSPITKRVYNLGLDEFLMVFPRAAAGLHQATVAAWRVTLETALAPRAKPASPTGRSRKIGRVL